jgi:hypothetical protein
MNPSDTFFVFSEITFSALLLIPTIIGILPPGEPPMLVGLLLVAGILDFATIALVALLTLIKLQAFCLLFAFGISALLVLVALIAVAKFTYDRNLLLWTKGLAG